MVHVLRKYTRKFWVVLPQGVPVEELIGDQKTLAFITSMAITTCEVATITFVIKGGWIIVFTSGLGGAVGVVCAMLAHDRIFRHRPVVIRTTTKPKKGNDL